MPDYTPNHGISYPVPGDRVKDTNVAAKLAADIQATAFTADAAITTEGQRAENAAKHYTDNTAWLKDVLVTVGDNLNDFAGVDPGTQVKAKIPNATVAASITGWPANLTPQGATVLAYGVTGQASLQQLQTHSNSSPRLFIRTSGHPWIEITNQHRRYNAQTQGLSQGRMHLQRSGHTVTVTLDGAYMTSGSTLIGTLPSGYKNEIRNAHGFSGRTGTGLPASFEIREYDQVHQYTSHAAALYGVLTFQTNEEYP